MENNNQILRFIIDTGAETSIINPNLCHPKWKLANEKVNLKVLDKVIAIDTVYSLPIFKEFRTANLFVRFVEFPFHKTFDGLIGNNVLKLLNAVIDFKEGLLKTDNGSMRLYFDKKEEFYPKEFRSELNIFFSQLDNITNEFVFSKHLNNKDIYLLKSLLSEFKDIFFKEGDLLSFTSQVKHRIFTENDVPIFTKSYRYPEIHRREVDRQIRDMLYQGIISESDSPYNSPIWVVPKKNQEWRLVVDYRKLNEKTIDDKFPIPNINEIFDKLGRCQFFSTLDLAKGFHQIELNENDKMKTAFSTESGHYHFNRMPFGLKNAPSTFQRLVNDVLKEFINKTCVVYMDDILIFSTSFQEHIVSIKRIFEAIRKYNLKIQINKCSFAENSTKFLGHVVESGNIRPDPTKVEAIQNYPLPCNQRDIRSFLGLTGYYRKFIKDYSKVAYPIIRYLRKNVNINQNDADFIASFNKLKTLITSDPILVNPDFNNTFTLTTDASNFALGAVLSQSGHPICYASRTLNNHEINYSTIEKELLAIVWAVKYFRVYIYGRKFVIQSDHKPLIWLNSIKEPNMKLQRWKILLNDYNFDIKYIQGRDNQVADCLSRIPRQTNNRDSNNSNTNCFINERSSIAEDTTIENNNYKTNNDNQNSTEESHNTLLHANDNDDIHSNCATIHSDLAENNCSVKSTTKPVNLFKRQIFLLKSYVPRKEIFSVFKNEKVVLHITDNCNLLTIMNEHLIKNKTYGIYCEDEELFSKFENLFSIYFQSSIKLLRCHTCLKEIVDIKEMLGIIDNEHKRNNHRGINELFLELKSEYFFPKLFQNITDYVNNCRICTLAKYDRHRPKIPFNITTTPSRINEIVHMDIWYPKRNVMYLTTIDRFTKYATAKKLKDRTWVSILNAIKSRIRYLGPMENLVSDGERCIISNSILGFLNDNSINFHQSTPALKTGNSDVERLHNTLNEHLRILECDQNNTPKKINDKIFKIMTIYNRTIHSTTKHRPIDFLTSNFSKEELQAISEHVHSKKSKIIEKLNESRDNNVELHDNVVEDRQIGKISPKYRILENYNKNGNYTIDKNKKPEMKYYKTQFRRVFKSQKRINQIQNNIMV